MSLSERHRVSRQSLLPARSAEWPSVITDHWEGEEQFGAQMALDEDSRLCIQLIAERRSASKKKVKLLTSCWRLHELNA